MTILLAIALNQSDFSAKRFFPLAAGNRWTYEDTLNPGAVIQMSVGKEVVVPPIVTTDLTTPTAKSYFPVDNTTDGTSTGVVDYENKDNVCYHVGNGENHPITPQPVLIVSRQPRNWDFYVNASAYSSEAVHFVAHSQMGPKETVLGESHDTVVVTMKVTLGPEKTGVVLNQVWKYAANVGLYEFDEDGHSGQTKVHHVRTLVKFEPGGSI